MKYRKIIESAMVVAFSLVVTASSAASGDVDTKAGQYDKGSEIQNETQAATKERAAIDFVAATQEETVPDWAADLEAATSLISSEAEATDDVTAVSPVANLAADLEATAANEENQENQENQANIGMEDNINTVISTEDGTTEELAAAEADQAGAEADAQAAAGQEADTADVAENQTVTGEADQTADQTSDQAVADEADQASNQAVAETDQAGAEADAQTDASQEADTADAAEDQTVTDEADEADQASDQAAAETEQVGADTDTQADASQEADEAEDQAVTDEADPAADQASDQTASDETDQTVDQAAEAIDWSTKLMPDVEEYLNVRAEASEDSEVVGKMYSGSVADIQERGEDWTKIRSGNVEGYVKNEFCFFDEEAKALAEENGVISAESQADDLRVRQEPSLDEDVVIMELLQKGDKVELDSETEAPEGWVAIKAFGTTGYVSADFVTVGLNLDTAISIEEEQEAIRAAKEAAAAKAEAEAQQSSSSASSTQTTQKAAVAASYDDVTLLGALIQCEAGSEPYEGKVAVGAVVMNRLRCGFAGSISGVIYQSGQFTPASSGSLASRLANGVDSSCISAAQEAISGVDNTGGALSFRNVRSGRSGLVIGHHVFF